MLLACRKVSDSIRIIPACAEKGRPGCKPPLHSADHPRLRGEGESRVRPWGSPGGSSPPARGRGGGRGLHGVRDRIIHACAGKGRPFPWPPRPGADHPRLRGEGVGGPGERSDHHGSPPPARGKAADGQHSPRPERIIPACAGKGVPGSYRDGWSADHPRLRGEGAGPLLQGLSDSGSSPPARGRGDVVEGAGAADRIIPACAGKGPTCMKGYRNEPDHPRLRGEGQGQLVAAHDPPGSSPPARGRGQNVLDAAGRDRIIPACAGKGCPSATTVPRGADHPRLRGGRTTARPWSQAAGFEKPTCGTATRPLDGWRAERNPGEPQLLYRFTHHPFWALSGHFSAAMPASGPIRKAPETFGFRGFVLVAGDRLELST